MIAKGVRANQLSARNILDGKIAKIQDGAVNSYVTLKQLRDENTRLKKLVVDLSLDKEMLKAVIAKNGWSS